LRTKGLDTDLGIGHNGSANADRLSKEIIMIQQFLSFEMAQTYLSSFKVKCKNRSLASKDKVFLFENRSKSFYVFRTWCHTYDKYIWNVQLLPKEVS